MCIDSVVLKSFFLTRFVPTVKIKRIFWFEESGLVTLFTTGHRLTKGKAAGAKSNWIFWIRTADRLGLGYSILGKNCISRIGKGTRAEVWGRRAQKGDRGIAGPSPVTGGNITALTNWCWKRLRFVPGKMCNTNTPELKDTFLLGFVCTTTKDASSCSEQLCYLMIYLLWIEPGVTNTLNCNSTNDAAITLHYGGTGQTPVDFFGAMIPSTVSK